jgi:hypothetical protein
MRRSVTSSFSGPDRFQAALSAHGAIEFIYTESGRFLARSTEIVLNQLRLTLSRKALHGSRSLKYRRRWSWWRSRSITMPQ